jgi:hypothetical protein
MHDWRCPGESAAREETQIISSIVVSYLMVLADRPGRGDDKQALIVTANEEVW